MEGLNFHQKTETKQVLVGAHISSFKKNPNRFSMLEESNKKKCTAKTLNPNSNPAQPFYPSFFFGGFPPSKK